MNKFINNAQKILSLLLSSFADKDINTTIEQHNGNSLLEYPENNWVLVPFPMQKGIPFNADNLATVNRHSFLDDSRFISARLKAEARWNGNDSSVKVRDVSWRLHVILWAVASRLKHCVQEDLVFIECGTGKGYMAAAIADFFSWNEDKPVFYLADSFKSTMPDKDGNQSELGNKLFVYAEGDGEVREYFSRYKNIEILTGNVPDVLTAIPGNKKVGFVHMDLNNAKAEKLALEYLLPRLDKGSIVLFDDYGGFGGEDQARVHEEFANRLGLYLLTLPTGQAIIII